MILIINNRIAKAVFIMIIRFGVIKLCQKIEKIMSELINQTGLDENHGFLYYLSLLVGPIDLYPETY